MVAPKGGLKFLIALTEISAGLLVMAPQTWVHFLGVICAVSYVSQPNGQPDEGHMWYIVVLVQPLHGKGCFTSCVSVEDIVPRNLLVTIHWALHVCGHSSLWRKFLHIYPEFSVSLQWSHTFGGFMVTLIRRQMKLTVTYSVWELKLYYSKGLFKLETFDAMFSALIFGHFLGWTTFLMCSQQGLFKCFYLNICPLAANAPLCLFGTAIVPLLELLWTRDMDSESTTSCILMEKSSYSDLQLALT